MERTKV